MATRKLSQQERAAKLAATHGAVAIKRDGSYSVRSSDGATRYTVKVWQWGGQERMSCTCKGAKGGWTCYHQLAVGLIRAEVFAAKVLAEETRRDVGAVALSYSFDDTFNGWLNTIRYRACELVAAGVV